MRISEYLAEECIFFGIKPGRSKADTLKQIVNKVSKLRKFPPDRIKKIIKKVLNREKLGSTAIGQGVAIPHVRVDFVRKPIISVAVFEDGVDLGALDGGRVFLVFFIISPEKSEGLHLKVLANISRLLRDKFFLAKLKSIKTPKDMKRAIEFQEKKI